MSCEVIGYVQYKEIDGSWNILPLFDGEGGHVCVWGGSDLADAINDYGVRVSSMERKIFLNQIAPSFDHDEEPEAMYALSLPYLKLLGKKNKSIAYIEKLVSAAFVLSGKDSLSIDEVRYIYYISY
jgi:hypothetical protein